jgi:hypothetical protein
MALFTIENAQIPADVKPLIFNFDVIRGSYGINLKRVTINVYASFITGDNERFETIEDFGIGSISGTFYGHSLGLPVGFTPGKIILDNMIVDLGDGADLNGSIDLLDATGNPVTFPHTITINQNVNTLGFTIDINNLITGTSASTITVPITVENSSGTISVEKNIVINLLNNS